MNLTESIKCINDLSELSFLDADYWYQSTFSGDYQARCVIAS